MAVADTGGRQPVTLALQGGAAHGAFIWGVLDALLEDDRLLIEGVSGASSGAINATLLADGLTRGGAQDARECLNAFWRRMSEVCEARRWPANGLLRYFYPGMTRLGECHAFFAMMARLLLPYRFDPKTMEPLRGVIRDSVDFKRLRSADLPRLYINATDIATVKNRVFDRFEVSLDAVCASACLPFLFEAVEIDGAQYWDGGYVGNPAIYPLIYGCQARDIILVLTSPLAPLGVPRTPAEILSRISHVSFTAAFMREMRAIAFVTDLIERGLVAPEAGLRKINLHVIAPPPDLSIFGAGQRFNAEWSFLTELKALGHAAAGAWLDASYSDIGHRSSFDIDTHIMSDAPSKAAARGG